MENQQQAQQSTDGNQQEVQQQFDIRAAEGTNSHDQSNQSKPEEDNDPQHDDQHQNRVEDQEYYDMTNHQQIDQQAHGIQLSDENGHTGKGGKSNDEDDEEATSQSNQKHQDTSNDDYKYHSNHEKLSSSSQSSSSQQNGNQAPPLQYIETELEKADRIAAMQQKQDSYNYEEAFKSRSPPILLEWKNLEYKVKVKKEPPSHYTSKEKMKFKFKNVFSKTDKTILHPMSGYVEPGHVLAIMGPSGAGKTSLLNILAQRVSHTNGDILANGQPAKKSLKALSAYVQQDDVLNGNLTVRETLRFAAFLRLSSKIPVKDKMRRVDLIMEELGLTKIADSVVGNPAISKGISGGERKRLSIAIELLTEPSILFLDEPTSGLDSKTSLNVFNSVKKLAEHGRTVVLTIHQPRSTIFKAFDKLLLLARGRVAFFGDASEATAYFAKIGYACPKEYNPGDYLMDLITENPALVGDDPVLKEKQNKRIEYILDKHDSHIENNPPQAQKDLDLDENLQNYGGYNSSWFAQFFVVMTRHFQNVVRDRSLTISRIGQETLMALLIGLIFLRLGTDQESVQNRIGVTFFMTMTITMNSIFTSLTSFLREDKAVFFRERGAKMYKVSSYYIGRWIASIPNLIFFPILFGVISYWIVGLMPTPDRFFRFILIIVMLSITGNGYGTLVSVLAPDENIAFAFIPLLITIFVTFSGFYLNVESIPAYFIWIYWINLFHFGFEGIFLNEFEGREFECPEAGEFCTFPNGQSVIDSLSMNGPLKQYWINIGFLALLTFACHVLSYLALRFLAKPKGA